MVESNCTVFVFFASILFYAISTVNSLPKKCTFNVADRKFEISDWVWAVPNFSAAGSFYQLSFCKPLQSCNNAAVCKVDAESRVNLGNKPSDGKLSAALAGDNSGFSVVFSHGKSCPDKTGANYTSEVYFFCGKTLGTPEFVEQNGCRLIFEFITVEACKTPPKVSEIPCSILDRNKKLRDLNQLVKTKGGHEVASATVKNFYINVCRGITGEVSPGKSCPSGSTSCVNGAESGRITQFSSLALVNDYTASLKYANSTNGCSTNITFVCPKSISQPGGSGPLLQSVTGCHYEVLWETEHACPVDNQVSTSCNITTSDGIFDLRPLQRSPPHYYQIKHRNEKDKKDYTYFMNICDNMKDFPCNTAKNGTKVAVCQTFGNGGKAAGDASHKKLRYVDNQLILTYKHGDVCSSGFRRTTAISFYCNETAGHGSPRFNHEDHCNYFFDWPTSIVCPRARSVGEACRVITKDNVIYDLTELTKSGRSNWRAVDGTTSSTSSSSSSSAQIYINVCSALQKNSLTNACPDDNAACIVDGDSHFGLGRFKSTPTSDSKNSVKLVYEGGTMCDITKNKRKRSVIDFVCHPGQLTTGPTLISKSVDGCDYEFVWQTAAACPLGRKTGSDCQVSDEIAGYSFDLRPLSKARPVQGKDYFSVKDSAKVYEYQIKVCKGSSQTQCSINGASIGGCQYRESTKMHKSIGKANSNLAYFDGMLKLTYLHGDKCRNGQYRETHITFLCEQTAEVGHPQFEKELSCGTYNFLWYTKYACQSKIVQCTAEDPKTKKQYDLSKLSNINDWQATQGNKKFYLNVCRPLYRRPKGCSAFSSVCDVEVKTSHGSSVEEFKNNLGSVSDPPVVEANGDLGSPEFDSSASDACNYIFKWETSYACPIGGSSRGPEGSCMVRDPVSKYTLNLSPLKRTAPFYRVTSSGGKIFILNICGSVSGSDCNTLDSKQVGGCIVTGTTGKNYVIGQVSKQLKYSVGQLTLEYSGGQRQSDGYEYETTIEFICNKNIQFGSPVFDKSAGHKYFFRFETSLACSPEPVQCRLAGPGNVMYNLEPLIKTKGYWTALNRESSGQKHHYFINVCQALDDRPNACPKGPIGACQVDYNAGRQTGHSIGYIVSNPNVKEKTLSIKYTNGEYCHHNKVNRTAYVYFHCSQTEGSPVFQTETNACGYIFNWLTPSACPRMTSAGSHCKVEDSVFKHMFDLSKLQSTTVSVGSNKFVVNPCGVVPGECSKNAAVCKVSGATKTNIGSFEDKLHLSDGDIFVEFANGDMKSKVKFVCDRLNTSLTLTTESSKITSQLKLYEFEWKTPLACLPHYNVQCSLFVNSQNQDEMYDLSPLSRWDDNWRAHVDADTAASYIHRQFYINVCRGVLKNDVTMHCPDDAGICMAREDGTIFSLGRILKSPYKENSEIILEYGEGDTCQETKKYSAKIRFTADAGEPFYHDTYSHVYLFARPINQQKATPRTDCKIVNPVTGYLLDLSSLKGEDDFKVVDGRGGYFMLSVCRPLKNQNAKSKCGPNSGICRLVDSDSSYHMNAGVFSQSVAYDKVASVKYTDGDVCPGCKCKRQTIITFVCAPEEGVGKPVFMSRVEDCTYVFVWRTKHVCEKEVQCTAFGKKNTFYIGQLIKPNANYVISSSANTKYYINVCKNLNYDASIHCPAGSAACMVKTVNGKSVATSLGEVISSPKVDDDNSITLTYVYGDECPTDKSKKIKTVIKFLCQHGPKGEPVLKSTNDCVYTFEWKTSAVCKEEEKVDEAKCTVDDTTTNNKFDLSPLKKTHLHDYKVNSRYKSFTYFINICGVTSVTEHTCAGSGVCRMAKNSQGQSVFTSLGLIKYQSLKYDSSQKALILKYQQDAQGSKAPISQITFTCDPLVDEGQPFIITDTQAVSSNYIFHWKTSLACPTPSVDTNVVFNSKRVSLKNFMDKTGYLSAEDKKYTYVLSIGGGIKDGPSGCPKTAALCRTSKAGDRVDVLAPVSTQEVAANSANITIDFTGGKSSCDNAKVEVVILCGEGGNKLLFVSSNEVKCSYLFHIKSNGNSNANKVTKPGVKPKVKHPAMIAVIVIAIALVLIIFGYIVKDPER
eukprot:gene415-1051_t